MGSLIREFIRKITEVRKVVLLKGMKGWGSEFLSFTLQTIYWKSTVRKTDGPCLQEADSTETEFIYFADQLCRHLTSTTKQHHDLSEAFADPQCRSSWELLLPSHSGFIFHFWITWQVSRLCRFLYSSEPSGRSLGLGTQESKLCKIRLVDSRLTLMFFGFCFLFFYERPTKYTRFLLKWASRD